MNIIVYPLIRQSFFSCLRVSHTTQLVRGLDNSLCARVHLQYFYSVAKLQCSESLKYSCQVSEYLVKSNS